MIFQHLIFELTNSHLFHQKIVPALQGTEVTVT